MLPYSQEYLNNNLYYHARREEFTEFLFYLNHHADIHHDDDKTLDIVCAKGNLSMVKLLVKKGGDYFLHNRKLLPGFLLSTQNGYTDVAKYLYEKSGNQFLSSDLDSALFACCLVDRFTTIEYLFSIGGNINIVSNYIHARSHKALNNQFIDINTPNPFVSIHLPLQRWFEAYQLNQKLVINKNNIPLFKI